MFQYFLCLHVNVRPEKPISVDVMMFPGEHHNIHENNTAAHPSVIVGDQKN